MSDDNSEHSASDNSKLEGYLAYLQSIEQNIDRRASMNKLNLSILIPALSAYGLLVSAPSLSNWTELTFAANLIIGLSGIICLVWLFQILRFREISRIKFQVAAQLEEELDLNIIRRENELEIQTRTILSYTHLELFMPICGFFGSCYLFFFVQP